MLIADELVDAFALEGISGGNAVFNTEKLDWFNQQHLLRMATRGLVPSPSVAFLRGRPLARAGRRAEREWIMRVLDLPQPRARRSARTST